VLSTVLTISTAPVVDSATGTAITTPATALAPTAADVTTEAIGSAESALMAEASDCACAAVLVDKSAQTTLSDMMMLEKIDFIVGSKGVTKRV
jgi:hypothetical protein